MKMYQFINAIMSSEHGGQETLIMLKDTNGTMYSIDSVEVEYHDQTESVGSTTAWVKISEY